MTSALMVGVWVRATASARIVGDLSLDFVQPGVESRSSGAWSADGAYDLEAGPSILAEPGNQLVAVRSVADDQSLLQVLASPPSCEHPHAQ
jgi:hypothetical protein